MKDSINQEAFQEAYKVAVNKSAILAPQLLLHKSDEEFDKAKQDVYKEFLETYLSIIKYDSNKDGCQS